MRYDAPDWDDVVAALAEAEEVVVACHVNPDGDALGSLLGACLALRKLGKRTYPTWGETPAVVPPSYAFLPGVSQIVQPGDVPAIETLLVLDCGAADRLGELEEHARGASCIINVDHHPGNDNFGTLNVVVPGASSTAELVTRLLQDLNAGFDRDIATCLYTGLVTDTGRFQYSSSSPETLRLAAELLSYGVPAPAIALEVFESSPFGYLKLLGRVLDRAELDAERRFVHSWITLEDLEATGVAVNETEKLVDLIRSTRDADVAAMFKQQTDGTYRVSLRSKGPVSVGAIARRFGGGGHELAAGYTAGDVDAAVAALKVELVR